jgi:hypothetical protein
MWGYDPADQRELFERVAFNAVIRDTDDHLRNQGSSGSRVAGGCHRSST